MNDKRINILLCFDDKDGNYTRRAVCYDSLNLKKERNTLLKYFIN